MQERNIIAGVTKSVLSPFIDGWQKYWRKIKGYGLEVAIIQPQKVIIPASLIDGFDENNDYTLTRLNIMTDFGIQRLKDVPLFEQE